MLCTCKHLRDLADSCEQLADEVDAGNGRLDGLLSEIAQLRAAFDAHRQSKRPDEADDGLAASLSQPPLQLVREPSPTSELRVVLAALRSYLRVEMRCSVGLTRRM